MRVLILVAAIVLLPGCWMGDSLYAPSDARPALPPGDYRDPRATDGGGRVSILPNGMTRLEERDGSRPSILGFAPLDDGGRRYVIWSSEEGEGRTVDDVGIYGLLLRTETGEFLLFMPQCEGTEPVARAAGATIELNGSVVICRFPDRASLEAALRQWQPDPEQAVSRLVRSGD